MRAETVLPRRHLGCGERNRPGADRLRSPTSPPHSVATEQGREVLLDLPQAVRLRDGDGLAVNAGGVVRVCARPEPLLEIHAHDDGEMMRIAWHLGNRHLPVQLRGERIRIRADHVIRDMVEGLGGHVDEIEAPFDPEAGAYAGGHHHQHTMTTMSERVSNGQE